MGLYRENLLREVDRLDRLDSKPDGRQPLIIGIDPGTTTAIAVLNFRGDIVLTQSGKEFSKADICRLILETGDPLIIATDINPPPKKVHKIASMLGAKLMFPEESLRKRHKEVLIDDAKEKRNRHEKDALAAAMYAYRKIRPMTNKIEQELERDQSALLEEISRKVIYEGKSIKKSIREASRAL